MLVCSNCGRENPDDAAFCMACGTALALAPAAREQRKTVTVLFCDVTGSTALGERLDPEAMRRVMTRYFDEMKTAVERHGGAVEKFIGDAVMAVFGIPKVHEDDALRAVRAATEMRDALARLNKDLERDHGVTFAARIGVNTGEVVAGDPTAGQALVTGDTVNVAARLEQVAAPGEALIGEATYRLVRDAAIVEGVEPLSLKGKDDAVSAFRLVSVSGPAAARARRMDSPMVGRNRQLALLVQVFEGAEAERSCHLFTVLGPAGVGKSRLAEEFLTKLAGRAEVLRGRCLPYGDGITYFPVLEMVKEAAGLADFDAPEVVEAKVCAVLEDDEQQAVVCSRVSQLLGVQEAGAPEETHWAIRRFLEAAARERPLVVVFDDIHWAEPALLDLIEHVADWSKEVPLFLFCMARPDLLDLRAAWGGGKMNATTVSLEPLSREECERLIANLLGAAELPHEIAERITQVADGNPLFVEEMLEMLIDDGRLERSDGSWVPVGEFADVAVPPSISALLGARLDRLVPEERAVIERASVVGKVFYQGAIKALFGDNRPTNLRDWLMGLVRRELVRPERSTLPGEESYRFRHLLIRDAAYDGMPKELRAELHERFAGWLEQVAGERIDEQEEIVAYHLERSVALRRQLGPPGEREQELALRAAIHLRDSGRRAKDRGDPVAAANLLGRSAELLSDDDPELPDVLFELGRQMIDTNELTRSVEVLERARNLAGRRGDRRTEWLARLSLSHALMMVDPHSVETDRFRDEIREAIGVFERLGDEQAQAWAWTELGETEWMPCRYGDAIEEYARARVLAERAGDLHSFDWATASIAAALYHGATPAGEALKRMEDMSAEPPTTPLAKSVVAAFAGGCRGMLGSLDDALAAYDAAESTFRDLGILPAVAAMYERRGDAARMFGDPAGAEDANRRRYEILHGAGDLGHLSTAATDLAWALAELGQLEEAERFARIGADMAAADDVASQAGAEEARALVLEGRGDLEGAIGAARRSIRIAKGGDWYARLGELHLTLSKILAKSGRRDEAIAAAREALGYFERKGVVPAIARTKSFLAGLAA